MADKDNKLPTDRDKFGKREVLGDPKLGEVKGTNPKSAAHDEGEGEKPPAREGKPTKKQRKAEAKREKALEEKLVNEGKIAVRYERRSFLTNVICITLALLFGIIIGLGGFLGGIALAGTKMSIKDVSDIAGFKYQDFVDEAYANYSLLDLIVEVVDDVKNSDELSVNTFAKYSPAVKNVVSDVLQKVEEIGVKVDEAKLMATPFANLTDYLTEDVLPAIELGGVLGVTADDDHIVKMLLYGKEGTDYTLDGNTIVPVEGSSFPLTVGKIMEDASEIIYGFELGEIMNLDATADGLILALCYGEKGVDYNVEGDKIVPAEGKTPLTIKYLIDNATDVLTGLKIQSILNIDATSAPVMRYLAFGSEAKKDENGAYVLEEDGKPTGNYYIENGEIKMLTDPETQQPYQKRTVNDLTSETMITGAKIGDLITIGEETSGLVSSIQNWTIDDLTKQERFETLVLGELLAIDEDATGLMGAIKDWTIADLKEQSKLEGLQIGDVLAVDEDAVGLMGAIKSWTIGDLKDQTKLEGLQIGAVLNAAEDATGLMGAIKGWTIGNLKQQGRIERLKIKDVITVGEDASNLMAAIADWRIMDLTSQEKLDTLTISDVLTVSEDAPKILKSLKDVSLGGFSDAVNELTLNDVLGGEDENLGDNKMLRGLMNSTLSSLPSDLEALSLADMFEEDIYSFAAKSVYSEKKRTPKNYTVSQKNVEIRFTANGEKVIAGYFERSGEAGNYAYALVTAPVKTDAEIVKNNRKEGAVYETPYYTETKTEVTPVYGAWQLVDYDKNVLVPLTAEQETWELTEDSAAEAHCVREGVRYDFERLITGYTLNGAPLPDGATVSEHRGVFTYTERTPVYERYYKESAPATTYAHDEVLERYFAIAAEGNVAAGEELTRYLGGLWFILVGESEAGAKTPVLDLASSVTTAITKLNTMSLDEMYARELIETEPDVDISKMHYQKQDGTDYQNLNELTITQVIDLVQKMIDRIGMIIG